MKKLTTALLGAALLLSPAAYAQNEQLPNSGFEEGWGDCMPWTSAGSKGKQGTTPSQWCISHVIGMKVFTSMQGATKTGEKVEGYASNSAVKIYNAPNSSLPSQTVPGYVTLGTTWSTTVGMGNKKDGGTFGGIDFTSRPDAIEFMYKRERSEGSSSTEKATVIAYLWKGTWTQSEVPGELVFTGSPKTVNMENRDRNILQKYYKSHHNNQDLMEGTQGGSVTKSEDAELIAVAEISIEETSSEWNLCHIDFEYFSKAIPEKFNVIFSAGDYFNSENLEKDNSLTVDDIKLIYYPREYHDGFLNIEMQNTTLTSDQASTISIANKSETTCDFTLPDFVLNMAGTELPLGDIRVPNVTITGDGNVKSYKGFVKDLALPEGEGDINDKIIADVTVTGTIDADNFVNMKIDVLWTNTGGDPTPIDVTFTTNAHPVAPTLQIKGLDINENETITVKDGEKVTLPMTDGIEIWYALEETSSAAEASYAPSRIPTDKNYELYDGSALDVKSGKNYNLTYIAKDTKTGLESEPKTVSFSTTVGIAAIEAENGAAEYFTLQGVRVAEPTNGIYIRVANGKASKVTVK